MALLLLIFGDLDIGEERSSYSVMTIPDGIVKSIVAIRRPLFTLILWKSLKL